MLLFATALVLVPGLILTLIAERSGSDSLQVVIGRQLASEAGHTADRLSALLRSERATLVSFARQDLMREIRVADIDKRVAVALATLRDGSPARRDYLVVANRRESVSSSDPSLIGPVPRWLEPGWIEPRAKPHVLGPFEIPLRRGPTVVMTTPIRDPDAPRRRLGTLVGLFDWQQLTALTKSVREALLAEGIAAEVLVARADGAVIGGAPSSSVGDASRRSSLAAAAGRLPGREPAYAVDESGGWIIGHASLAADLPDWKVLVLEPRAHALAPARNLSKRLVLTMGLALLAALALAALGARRVVEPLSELTRAIRGLAHGDAGALRVPVRTEDEVGELGDAFNQMSSELDRAQRDLVEAEKFAFVGELAAGIAHETRTALGVLGSSAQILERSLPPDTGAETAELAQMIREEVRRLEGVVNDLLTLDRVRPPELEPTRVSEPLLRAVEFVRPQAREKGVELAFSGVAAEQLVLCEAELMFQVAVNLLVNAVHALGRGGTVKVRVLEAREGYGGFDVSDDGPGVSDEMRERIFQPFVTAREGGVGLGLTFVKRVVHDHRGTVSLESSPGRGARFRIRLPVAEDAS